MSAPRCARQLAVVMDVAAGGGTPTAMISNTPPTVSPGLSRSISPIMLEAGIGAAYLGGLSRLPHGLQITETGNHVAMCTTWPPTSIPKRRRSTGYGPTATRGGPAEALSSTLRRSGARISALRLDRHGPAWDCAHVPTRRSAALPPLQSGGRLRSHPLLPVLPPRLVI